MPGPQGEPGPAGADAPCVESCNIVMKSGISAPEGFEGHANVDIPAGFTIDQCSIIVNPRPVNCPEDVPILMELGGSSQKDSNFFDVKTTYRCRNEEWGTITTWGSTIIVLFVNPDFIFRTSSFFLIWMLTLKTMSNANRTGI